MTVIDCYFSLYFLELSNDRDSNDNKYCKLKEKY